MCGQPTSSTGLFELLEGNGEACILRLGIDADYVKTRQIFSRQPFPDDLDVRRGSIVAHQFFLIAVFEVAKVVELCLRGAINDDGQVAGMQLKSTTLDTGESFSLLQTETQRPHVKNNIESSNLWVLDDQIVVDEPIIMIDICDGPICVLAAKSMPLVQIVVAHLEVKMREIVVRRLRCGKQAFSAQSLVHGEDGGTEIGIFILWSILPAEQRLVNIVEKNLVA